MPSKHDHHERWRSPPKAFAVGKSASTPSRPQRPVLARKVGVAVELITQAPRVARLKRRRLDAERREELVHERLHPLTGADDDPRACGLRLWAEEPAGCEGSCYLSVFFARGVVVMRSM